MNRAELICEETKRYYKAEQMDDKDPTPDKKEAQADLSAMLGMGGFLDGVTNLINKFGELAERGETLRKSSGETASGKAYQSSAGFSIKFGPGKDGTAGSDAMHVAPVNQRTTKPAPRSQTTATEHPAPTAAMKIREPHIDIFEEEEHTLILAEMPGVATDDLQLTFDELKLQIEGKSKTAHFKADVDLPRVYSQEQVSLNANNGVIEIHLRNM